MKNKKIDVDNEPVYLEPEDWGFKFWYTIESVILSMDFSDINSIESVYLFFITIQYILPCPTCREHYQEFLKENDLQKYFVSKRKLFYWTFKLQNEIKERNGEKPFPHFEFYLRHVYKKLKVKGMEEFLIEDEERNYRIVE